MRSKRDDGGYTLTEMLVVIGIIGLLAAALTPALIGQLSRARVKTARLQLETVSAALEQFRSDVSRYPSDAEGLAALVKSPTGAEGWLGPYLRDPKALNDPWGRPIAYRAEPGGDRAELVSLGSDGKTGGDGTAADIHVP
jgi:general secretion pathway protein G